MTEDDSRAEVNFNLVVKENANRLSAHIGLVKIYRRNRKQADLKREAFSVIILSQRIGAYNVALKHISDVLGVMQIESDEIDFDKTFFTTSSDTPLLLKEEIERLAYDYAEAYATHAETLDGLGQSKKAVVYYNVSLRYIDQLKKWYSWQSSHLEGNESPKLVQKKAIIEKKLDRVRNREYRILLSMGWLLQEKPLSRFEQALRLQSKAKQIQPTKPQADFLTGIILFNMGEKKKEHYGKAINHLEEAIRLHASESKKQSMPSSYYFYLGMALEKQNRFPEAEQKLKQAIENDPHNSTYLNYLGYMYSLRSIKLKQASELLVRALEDDPENEAYLDSLGWILFQKGKYKDALQQLLQAANYAERKERADSVIYFHLAETYFRLNDYSLSHFYYTKSLSLIKKASEEIDENYIRSQINKIESNKKNQ